MNLSVALLAAAAAFGEAPAKPAQRPPEETLRVMLADLRRGKAWETRKAIVGDADELRDAVAAGTGVEKARLADRLPGMARDPFSICRDLRGCPEAPQSLHVEDAALIDDAFLALARPWFKLQEARGKAVTVAVSPGAGVKLGLKDFPKRPVVTLEASPAPTGGFDVTLADGPAAAKAYIAARSALLRDEK